MTARRADLPPTSVGLDDEAHQLIDAAREEAVRLGDRYVTPLHIVAALASGTSQDARLLEDLGVSLQGLRRQVDLVLGWGDQSKANEEVVLSRVVEDVIERAGRIAVVSGCTRAGVTEVVTALLDGHDVAAEVLGSFAVTRERVENWRHRAIESVPLPPEIQSASSLAVEIVEMAAIVAGSLGRSSVGVDDLGCLLLALSRERSSRVTLALHAADFRDGGLSSDVMAIVRRPADQQRPLATVFDDELSGCLASLPRWQVRTGDQAPDTAHLLLAICAGAPGSRTAKTLAEAGVTADLLTGFVVGVPRQAVNVRDQPGRRPTPTRARPVPPPPTAQPGRALRRSGGINIALRALLHGQAPTGQHIDSDLERRRLRRWELAVITSSAATLVRVAGTIYASRSNPLIALTLLGANSQMLLCVLPTPVWLAAEAVAVWVLPVPVKVATVVGASAAAYECWTSLQWRRSDLADPSFDLRRLRHDVRTSIRAMPRKYTDWVVEQFA